MIKVFRCIRKLTVPPVFAALLLVILYIWHPSYIGNYWQLLGGIVFLTILPLSAYPLQKYIPHFKDKGRDGQRSLAMLLSAAGYLLGALTAFALNAPREFKIIYLEYLLCGIAMLLINKIIKRNASGHACSIVGPVLLLLYFKMYLTAFIGVLLVIPVFVSSVKTKQHTVPQLIGGGFIPVVILCIVLIIMG